MMQKGQGKPRLMRGDQFPEIAAPQIYSSAHRVPKIPHSFAFPRDLLDPVAPHLGEPDIQRNRADLAAAQSVKASGKHRVAPDLGNAAFDLVDGPHAIPSAFMLIL